MYHAHFGLRESPFTLTPDPRYLFMSDAHKEALASMIYGVQERKGFVLILGEVGTGKTTLIRHLLGHFGDNVTTIYIFNSMVGFDELLQGILRELELPCPSRQRLDVIETLNDYLLRENAAGRYVVLIVDEAQHLSPEVLEELRMLSNLETSRNKLLQIILVGQPELGQKLGRPGLRQLRQRIGLVAELKPLTAEETAQYIAHRLEIAGHKGRVIFSRSALKKIHAAAGGIPRLVNVLCDKSLVLAFGDGARQISRKVVNQVAKDWVAFTRDPAPLPNAGQRRAGAADHRMRPRPRLGRIAAGVLVPLAAVLLAVVAAQRYTNVLDRLTHQLTGNTPSSLTATAVDTVPPAEVRVEAKPVVDARRPEPAAETRRPEPKALETRAASVPSSEKVEPTVIPSVREVSVRPGDTLSTLVFGAYGRADVMLLDHVKMANPSVADINVIEVGKRLRFPPLDAARMVHRQGSSHYVLHLTTVSRRENRVLDKLGSVVADQGRKLYVVPVRFTDGIEVYRVLVGDFDDQAQAEKFSRAVPASLRPVDLALEVTR